MYSYGELGTIPFGGGAMFALAATFAFAVASAFANDFTLAKRKLLYPKASFFLSGVAAFMFCRMSLNARNRNN